tara:strand:+ start:344 stop:685 length:342 start_codon:yes stop_codon:yes gene_type:complete
MSENPEEHKVYVDPDAQFLHPGDIRRENPDWEIGDELPAGWHEVSNAIPPEVIFIYPEFGEGEDETNTAPLQYIGYKRELSITSDENGDSVYGIVWNAVTNDIVEEPPPHETG